MAVSIATLIIGAGIAVYGAVKKGQDAKKDRAAAAANKRPDYEIPQEERDNIRMLEGQANQGMGSDSREYYQNQANQGLSSASEAIMRGGGDANLLSGAYNQYQKGINSLSVYDDQVRQQHLQALQSGYLRMSGAKDKEWQLNQYAPWADKAQQIAQQTKEHEAANNATMQSGFNMAGQGLGGLAGGINTAGGAGGMNKNSNRSSNPYDATALNTVNENNNFTNNFGGGMSPDGGVGYSSGWGWDGISPARQ